MSFSELNVIKEENYAQSATLRELPKGFRPLNHLDDYLRIEDDEWDQLDQSFQSDQLFLTKRQMAGNHNHAEF